MRIFRHRGDIYFSKANKEKSNEQKILLIALVAVVSFTIIFVTALSIKYNFNVKEFFKPDNFNELAVTNNTSYEEVDLPEVSGKCNFLTMIYEDKSLLFAVITQVDLDTQAYKVSVLKGNAEFDGTTLEKTFYDSGALGTAKALSLYLGIDIDHYISMKSLDYKDFYNSMGSIRYPIVNDVKYKNTQSAVSYSLKIDAGEQNIDGKEFVNLIRYYLDIDNTALANELFLAALSQQLCSDNYSNGEALFKKFISASETDITIRDFSQAQEELLVISHEQTAMGVYNAAAVYENNKITDESLTKIKGYFVK